MQALTKSLSSFYAVVLAVIVVLSLGRALTPLSSRAASWREALTEVMSQSIVEGHFDLFEAHAKHIHPTNTRFAAEFPIYTGLVAIAHKIFGPQIWQGRIVSLLFALLGLVAFYRIILLSFTDMHLSLLSTILLALSNWLIIGTQVMPDVPAAALALFAVLFASRYLRDGNLKWLVSATLLTLIAGLTKLPALILLLWIVLGIRDQPLKRTFTLSVSLALAAIPSMIYYFVWLPELVQSGAMALMYPTSISEGLAQVFGSHRSNSIDMIMYRGWGGYVLSILGLVGSAVLLSAGNRSKSVTKLQLILLYGGSFLGLLLFSAKAGATLATHPYYAIPFLPLFALGGASLIVRSPKIVLIYVVCLAALVEISVRHFAKDKQGQAFAELSQQIEGKLPEGPYVSGFNLNPQPAYYFDRPTWAWSIDNINELQLRQAAISEGATGIIMPSVDTSRLNFGYQVFAANSKVAIVNF